MLPKLGGVVTYHVGLPPMEWHDLWSRSFAKPRYKLKTNLHYHSAYRHQTWQDGDLPWGVSSHQVTWPLDHPVLKRSRDKLEPSYLHHHIFTSSSSSCDITRQIKNIISLLPQCLWQPRFVTQLQTRGFYPWPCKITWQIKYIISSLP